MVTLTPHAAEQIKKMIAKHPHAAVSSIRFGFRLAVRNGGCHGLSYVYKIDRPGRYDQIFCSEGVSILVDPKSILLLDGTEIDYTGDLINPFNFRNPHAATTCGCHGSFEPKKPSQ